MRLSSILPALSIGIAALFQPALAQDSTAFPNKPVRIIVPYAPGGFTDIVARLLAQNLGQKLGQPVVVENKPGASTIIGAEMVAKAPPDGHTLLMAVTTTLSTNQFMFKKLPYKGSDFTPVALAALTPYILVAHPSVPANTVPELVALAKSKPDSLNMATLGIGSSPQLVAEMLNAAAGVKIKDVPYKGSGPASADLMAGHVQLYFDAIPTSMPRIRSGQLKGIAVTSDVRSPAAPTIPTFAEAGLRQMVAYSWYGLMAPAGTPAAVVQRLNRLANEVLQTTEVRSKLDENGGTAPQMSPQEFGALIESHSKVWEKIIKPLNIQLD